MWWFLTNPKFPKQQTQGKSFNLISTWLSGRFFFFGFYLLGFWRFSPDALLECCQCWKYDFYVLLIAGIEVLNNWRLLNPVFPHSTAIFNDAQGHWLVEAGAFWQSLMTVLWGLCQKDIPHQPIPAPHSAGHQWDQSCPCRFWRRKSSVIKILVERLEFSCP